MSRHLMSWVHAVSPNTVMGMPEFDPNYRFSMYDDKKSKATTTHASPSVQHGQLFGYSQVPLKDGRFIRLVTIEPGTDDSTVECTLKCIELGQHLDYEAISYTWGIGAMDHAVRVNGAHFSITKNLHAFLVRARPPPGGESRTFWIDQICINQADGGGEVPQQIKLMQDIYVSAPCVRIWLGEETESTRAAFQLADAMCKLAREIEQSRFLTPEDMENTSTGLLAKHVDSAKWAALDQLYWSAWFGRTWVIQELALAKSAVVQCGSHVIPWDDLSEAGQFLMDHSLATAVNIDPYPVLAMQSYRDVMCSSSGAPSLLQMLFASRSSRSTKPHDKIYGLLAIAAADPAVQHIKADYEVSVEQAYSSLAKTLIAAHGNLDVLSATEDHRFRAIRTLPSWVPDWTSHPRCTPFLSQPSRWGHFRASADRPPRVTFASTLGPHGISTSATFAGKILGAIKSVGGCDIPVRTGHAGLRDMRWLRRVMAAGASIQRQRWENLAIGLGERYVSGEETPMEALYHTLVAEGLSAEEHDLKGAHEAWKKHCKYLLNHRFNDLPALQGDEEGGEEERRERNRATLYNHAAREAMRFRRPFVADNGYLGLASYGSQPGDVMCLLYGGRTVYILREVKEGGREAGKEGQKRYRFICEAYARGLMDGQGMEDGFGRECDFELV